MYVLDGKVCNIVLSASVCVNKEFEKKKVLVLARSDLSGTQNKKCKYLNCIPKIGDTVPLRSGQEVEASVFP